MRKISWDNHIKNEYVMSLTVEKGYREENRNHLVYRPIDKDNVAEFSKPAFSHPSRFRKGRYIGGSTGGAQVAFLKVVLNGERGAFFEVKQSDMCLEKLYVFPEWRGRGIIRDAMSHCICSFFPRGKEKMTISLYVRTDNAPAIKCYTKMGFRREGEIKIIRLFRDYTLPRTIV